MKKKLFQNYEFEFDKNQSKVINVWKSQQMHCPAWNCTAMSSFTAFINMYENNGRKEDKN